MRVFFLEKVKEKNLEDAVAFIAPYEQNCVELMSRLLDGSWQLSVYSYYILYEGETIFKKRIVAVLMKSTGGLLQHCFPDCMAGGNGAKLLHSRKLARALKPLFTDGNLYCIMGERVSTEFMAHLAEKFADGKKIIEEKDYLLLSYHPENLPDGLFDRNFDFEVVECGSDDAGRIFDLQKQYMAVEVVPKGKKVSDDMCSRNVELMLKKQMVYAVGQDGKLVAKAGSNAIGKNLIQLGGVFTDEKYRGQGMAQCLVSLISKRVLDEGKQPVLFVRTHNESAKKAYRKCGYIYQNDYLILYYDDAC